MAALMILGMHRSYTSLTAQWLMKSGLDIGKDLLGPAASNPDGHFEDVDFVRFHEALLASNNLPLDGIRFENDRAFDVSGFMSLARSESDRGGAAALRASRPSQFGWKDPRTCLFLPLWRSVLPDATSLVVVRHFDEVVRSLDRRDRALLKASSFNHRFRARIRGRLRSHDAFLGAWVHYNRCLLDHLDKSDSLVILDLEASSPRVVQALEARGFQLRPLPVSHLMRTRSAPAKKRYSYPYDRDLLAEAEDLYEQLAWRASQEAKEHNTKSAIGGSTVTSVSRRLGQAGWCPIPHRTPEHSAYA
jgi:hypothetical protein